MQVREIDERRIVRERDGGDFVVFVYTGDGAPQTSRSMTSWSVDSLLVTGASLPEVLHWIEENVPTGSCWSLGVVREPARPSPESAMDVSWIVGSDVLNMSPADRTPDQQRTAEEMLARRHRVELSVSPEQPV
jgi:hypothetical protein